MQAGPRALATLRDWLRAGTLPRPGSAAEAREIVLAARWQGLAGLLHEAVAREPEGWPEAGLELLREAHRRALFEGVQQRELARRVRGLLLRAGIRVLPLKGVALAERAYDSLAERPMQDVDLLVLEGWLEAARLLESEGLRRAYAGDHGEAFLDPGSRALLELHHSPTSCPGFFPVDADALWSRALPVDPVEGPQPSPEDLLVHLSLHAAFQHGLSLSLVQFLDFRRVMEREAPDPARLADVALACGAAAAVGVAVEAAGAMVGCPLPDALRQWTSASLSPALRRWLERRVADPIDLLQRSSASAVAAARWHLAAGRRTELIARTLAPPIPGSSERGLRRLAGAVSRASGLAGRWAGPLLRS
jgi:hypothetical protein